MDGGCSLLTPKENQKSVRSAGKATACFQRAKTLRWARGREGCSDSPSLPLDSTHPATGQGLHALDDPKEVGYTGKN